MAIVAQNGLDPNQQQQANGGGSGTIMGAPGTAAPGGGGGGGGTAYQGSGGSQAPRTNPSGAPNVQDYLNANQNAGNKLSSGITNNYQNQANQYQQGLSSQQQNLNSQYDPLNQQAQQGQSYANQAFKDPQALLSAYQSQQAQQAQGPNAAPTNAAAAPDQNALQNYNNFESTVNGSQQYNQMQQGISGFQNSGQQAGNYLQAQLGQLGQTAQLGANQMGQKQLLQQTVGTPNYTPGQQNLDSLFLQGNTNQLQKGLNDIYGNASNATNNASQEYQGKLNALQQLTGQNADYTKNMFLNGGQGGTGLNQIAGNVQNEYNQLASSSAAQQAALGKNIKSPGSLTADQIQQLGLQSGQKTWGTDLSSFLTNNALSAANQGGNAQAANKDEFARYNALNQLAGGGNGTLQNSIFGTSQQAGNYNPVSFDKDAANAAIQNRQQTLNGVDFQNALKNLMPNIGAPQAQTGGGFHSAVYDSWGGLRGQLGQKGLTADQANTDIKNYEQSLYNQENPDFRGGMMQSMDQMVSPFTNWYNSVYSPSANSMVGSSSPDDVNHQMPSNGKGGIDWSQITAPQGK